MSADEPYSVNVLRHAAAANGRGELDPGAEAIRHALLEESPDMTGTGATRLEVAGTNGLLHHGVATLMFGERGSGKSWAALTAGIAAAVAGRRVLYLDRENGPALTRERYEDILDGHEEWEDDPREERFYGRHWPELQLTWQPADFARALDDFDVVIYDSLREMLGSVSLDPNSEQDVSLFFAHFVTPLLRQNGSVVLLDNTGHLEPNRPKGSGTKLDVVQQAYRVKTSQQFTPTQRGLIELYCTRSRYGDAGREWLMSIGNGIYAVPATSTAAPDLKRAQSRAEAYEAFRQACVVVLRLEHPLGREKLLAAVKKLGIRGRITKLRSWLSELVSDPSSGVVHDPAVGYDLWRAP